MSTYRRVIAETRNRKRDIIYVAVEAQQRREYQHKSYMMGGMEDSNLEGTSQILQKKEEEG